MKALGGVFYDLSWSLKSFLFCFQLNCALFSTFAIFSCAFNSRKWLLPFQPSVSVLKQYEIVLQLLQSPDIPLISRHFRYGTTELTTGSSPFLFSSFRSVILSFTRLKSLYIFCCNITSFQFTWLFHPAQ